MGQSEFDWARDADNWDTVTLQQFVRLRAMESTDGDADAPRPSREQGKRRVQPQRSKAASRASARRRRRPTTAGS